MVNRRQLCSKPWEFKERLILETLFTKQTEHLSPTSKHHIYMRAVLQYQNTRVDPCKEKSSRGIGAVRCSGASSPLPAARGKGVTSRHICSLLHSLLLNTKRNVPVPS